MSSKDRRIQLHRILEGIPGVKKAYFQAPKSDSMKYPCIRYSRNSSSDLNADDIKYVGTRQYQVIVIDPDPDTEIPEELYEKFNQIHFDRSYTANNLNHYVFTLYY